jgi:hypothetical protein
MTLATGIDWDAYRAAYDGMTYGEQVAFYSRVWDLHPDQHHYDPAACAAFLEAVKADRVIEIGGWRGHLAAEMLTQFPKIKRWHNIELCRGAVQATVCEDPRYTAQVPGNWAWTMIHEPGGVLVAAHVIEHMTAAQVALLLGALHPRAAFVQSPLTEDGQDWAGYGGSHVLRAGWRDVIALFAAYGLAHDPTLDAPDVRCFR